MDDFQAFAAELQKLNGEMKDLFDKGDVSLFTAMNQSIKELYRIDRKKSVKELEKCETDLGMIYENFDMIIRILRTTEEGEIDRAAENTINSFLHNIDAAVIRIASKLNLI